MDDAKIRKVLRMYRRELIKRGAKPVSIHHEKIPRTSDEKLDHILGMIPKMYKFLNEGRREKVMRWLGFIQGVLWATKVYSVDELKNHNRP